MCAVAIGSLGMEPHRVDLVLVCCGQARRGRLEVGAGGIELAAQPRHHPEPRLDHRTEPLPPLLEARAQRLEHLGRPAQVGTRDVVARQGGQRREQLVVAQVGPAQLQAPLEVGGGGAALIALRGRGEESPLQPQRPSRGGRGPGRVWRGRAARGPGSGRCAPRPARRDGAHRSMPAGRPRPPRRTARPARSGRRPAASPVHRRRRPGRRPPWRAAPGARSGAPTRRRPRAATRGETASRRFPTARAPARPRARR